LRQPTRRRCRQTAPPGFIDADIIFALAAFFAAPCAFRARRRATFRAAAFADIELPASAAESTAIIVAIIAFIR
jgi:hypothetical protein